MRDPIHSPNNPLPNKFRRCFAQTTSKENPRPTKLRLSHRIKYAPKIICHPQLEIKRKTYPPTQKRQTHTVRNKRAFAEEQKARSAPIKSLFQQF